tara:strand:- start:403 stop:765 length:363 start_codon:yes stop_codon:yes gene_type:complete
MKKLLIILIIIPLIFSSCQKNTGTVKYEITSESNYFEVQYTNKYGNDVTEMSNNNNWSTEVEGEVNDLVALVFDQGGLGSGSSSGGAEVFTTMKISFNDNVLISYSAETNWEYISTYLEE